MGDTLLLTPLVRLFSTSHPSVPIDILAQPLPAQVLKNNPYLNSLILYPSKRTSVSDYIDCLVKLRRRRYSLVVDFLSTPGSALMAYLTGAKERLGWKLKGRSFFFTKAVESTPGLLYGAVQKARLLNGFITLTDEDKLLPEVYLTGEDEWWGEEWWRDRGAAGNLWGLAPYCRKPERMWLLENWISLTQRLRTQFRAQFALFALESERPFLRPLIEALGEDVLWVGAPDLLKAAAVLKRCRVILTGENGILHLSIAVRRPTLSIFCGRDDPRLWVPYEAGPYQFLDFRGVEVERTVSDALSGVEAFLLSIEG